MDSVNDVVLSVLLAGVFLYVLFFVVRAAVEEGIRRALAPTLLRPSAQEAVDAREAQRSEQG